MTLLTVDGLEIGFRHEGTAVDADWFMGEWTSLATWATLAPSAVE